jgi:hypothetical protein
VGRPVERYSPQAFLHSSMFFGIWASQVVFASPVMLAQLSFCCFSLWVHASAQAAFAPPPQQPEITDANTMPNASTQVFFMHRMFDGPCRFVNPYSTRITPPEHDSRSAGATRCDKRLARCPDTGWCSGSL